jgi:hypothetical protein
VAEPGLAAGPAAFPAEGAVLDPEYALCRNTSWRQVDPMALDGAGALLAGFLLDAFEVFGNLSNSLVLLGFFQQPGFDCLGGRGRG